MFYTGTEKPATMKVLRGGEVVTLPDVTFGPTRERGRQRQYATDFRVAAHETSVHSVAVVTGEMFRYYSGAILGGFLAAVHRPGRHGGTVRPHRYGVGGQPGCALWLAGCAVPGPLIITVGMFNLLPIPALDGCKLLFLAAEGMTRPCPVPDSVQRQA